MALAAQIVDDKSARTDSWLQRVSSAIDGTIQRFFGGLGFFVGTRPWTVIGLALVFTLVCVVGVLEYEEESRPEKLWTVRRFPPALDVWKHRNNDDVTAVPTNDAISVSTDGSRCLEHDVFYSSCNSREIRSRKSTLASSARTFRSEGGSPCFTSGRSPPAVTRS